MTTGFAQSQTGTWLDVLTTIPFVIGFIDILIQALPALLTAAGGLFGGNEPVNGNGLPTALPPTFPDYQQGFGDYLFNRMYTKPDGGVEFYGHQAFPGAQGQQGEGNQEGPGVGVIGPLSPDINSTILPNVYQNWQPWDGGTQWIADTLYNKMNIGQDDPRSNQLMTQGGFGGPGHQGMATALQYGTPSEAGRYLANLAQFGVTSQPMGDFMKQAMQGGLNQYRKAPVPQRG